MLNLDTHIFLRALAGDLKPSEDRLLADCPWGVSAIVFWEIAKLKQLERIDLDIGSAAFRRAIAALHVWPIDTAVSVKSTELDVYSDPADELILATSVVYGVPLVSRDEKLRKTKMAELKP